MKVLCILVSLCLAAAFAAETASALEIRVAPQTLVLSSSGGQLTVHTDVPYLGRDMDVVLEVAGEEVGCWTFADSRGNLVAQCSKDAAKDAIGEIEEKTATVTVTLIVFDESASENIQVKK